MARQRVYLLPPAEESSDELLASVLETPLVALDQVAHVMFEGLCLEAGRGDGIHITGGREVRVAGCVIRNLGQDGVVLRQGERHEIISCDIHHIGMRGVSIGAGDRKTLTPCAHRVHNCHLHHIARRGKTYMGAISLEHDFAAGEPASCGAIITQNRLHDHPHTLLFFWGNDHRIENNEFYNFTLEGDDCGCLYAGRDFTFQGTVIRNNYFHHGGDSGNEAWGSSGVYLDDGAGGTRIEENLFLWVNRAVQAGGGINTVIERNAFANCDPAVWFDERCASARADRGETMVHRFMKERFDAVDGAGALYRGRYPNLDRVAQSFAAGDGVRAWGAVISDNAVLGTRCWLNSAWTEMPPYVRCGGNSVRLEWQAGAAGAAQDVLALLRDAFPAARRGWAVEGIGLVRDPWRKKLDDVWTRLEVVRPPAATGKPGEARLVVRNAGDSPARGREVIEIRRCRHAAASTWVEVAYAVAPGEERAYSWSVPLPKDFTEEDGEVYLISRGEDIRPAWTFAPVACDARAEWESIRRPRLGCDPAPGEAVLKVISQSDRPVPYELEVKVAPESEAELVGMGTLQGTLAAGAAAQWRVGVQPCSHALISRIGLTARGRGWRPARLDVPVEYGWPAWEAGLGLDDVAQRTAAMPVFPVAREFPTGRPMAKLAEMRLARAGESWLVLGQVWDPVVAVTDSLWDGSCIELFAATMDQARLANVFGNIGIGHVLLVPADGRRPARMFRFHEAGAVPVSEGAIRTRPVSGGYQVEAILPFDALDLPCGAREFLFEIQVTTGFNGDHPQRRGTCFGSAKAYKDTSRYALAVPVQFSIPTS